MGQTCFIISAFTNRDNNELLCIMLTFIQHFAWQFYFILISAFAIHIAKNVDTTAPISMDKISKMMVLVSALISIATVASAFVYTKFSKQIYLNPNLCWLDNEIILPYFFMIPLAISIFVNIIAFSMIVYKVKVTTIQTNDNVQASNHANISKVIVRLFLLMGFTWIFGFLANINSLQWLWYAFVSCNSLQGVYLYFSFGFKKC